MMRTAAIAGAVATLAFAPAAMGGNEDPMVEKQRIAREWVEIREECSAGRTVFRSLETKIAPSRGGRRRLDLEPGGHAERKEAGPTDRIETSGTGSWALEGDRLRLNVKGWEGEYEIEDLSDQQLILRKR